MEGNKFEHEVLFDKSEGERVDNVNTCKLNIVNVNGEREDSGFKSSGEASSIGVMRVNLVSDEVSPISPAVFEPGRNGRNTDLLCSTRIKFNDSEINVENARGYGPEHAGCNRANSVREGPPNETNKSSAIGGDDAIMAFLRKMNDNMNSNMNNIRGTVEQTNRRVETMFKEIGVINDNLIKLDQKIKTVEESCNKKIRTVDLEAKDMLRKFHGTCVSGQNHVIAFCEDKMKDVSQKCEDNKLQIAKFCSDNYEELEGKINQISSSFESKVETEVNKQCVAAVGEEMKKVQNSVDNKLSEIKQEVKETVKIEVSKVGLGTSQLGPTLNKVFNVFEPNGPIHPVEFLGEFKSLPNYMSDVEKIEYMKGYMRGDAYSWAADVAETCTSWEDFKKQYIEKFWSQRERNLLLQAFTSGSTYDSYQGTMRQFCQEWVRKAKYLSAEMKAPPVLIGNLVNKLPERIRGMLLPAPKNDVDDFLNYLEEVERIDSKGRNYSGNGEQNQNHFQTNGTYYENNNRNRGTSGYQNNSQGNRGSGFEANQRNNWGPRHNNGGNFGNHQRNHQEQRNNNGHFWNRGNQYRNQSNNWGVNGHDGGSNEWGSGRGQQYGENGNVGQNRLN